MNIAVILFEDYETLDVFGPVEIFGRIEEHSIKFYSESGGLIKNAHGVLLVSEKFPDALTVVDILLIPGGMGTRTEVKNEYFIEAIRQMAEGSKYVLTVCTGSALLAKTGLLDNRMATSNKRAFEWAVSTGSQVKWIRKARWVEDGKFYTSSGVSAGMDMALSVVNKIHGYEFAKEIANQIEYNWQDDKDQDDFAKESLKIMN